MFTSKKSDIKKYVLKLQDYKKDSISKLRYLKIITGDFFINAKVFGNLIVM